MNEAVKLKNGCRKKREKERTTRKWFFKYIFNEFISRWD